jgi:hypothetical protein
MACHLVDGIRYSLKRDEAKAQRHQRTQNGEREMFTRLMFGIAVLALTLSANAFTPRTGHWNNANESGSGYNIDIQDGIMVVTIYSYKTNGDSEWYIASGPMSGGQSVFTGTLLTVRGGQCISCGYVAPTSTNPSGTITINFTSETAATVSLPGGRVTSIAPFNFGFDIPPQGLLGEWVYVENIGGVDFADRYHFTTIIAGTANGNGIAADFVRVAGCELQVIGVLSGMVVCSHSNSAGTLLDIYLYRFGLDQTFNGLWQSPTTMNQYPMKGYMSISRSGFSKSSSANAAPVEADLKSSAEQSSSTQTVQSSDYAAAVAAAVEAQRRALMAR